MMDQSSTRPTSADQPAVEGPADASRMSFGDHLDELRRCLIRALVGVAIGTIISLVFGKDILEVIYRPLLIAQHANDLPPHLQVLAPTAAFTAYLKIGFLSGLIVTMPWVLYQIWTFVATGLYAHERKFVRTLIPTSVGLFFIGVLFLYFIVLPIVLQFFIRFNQAFEAPSLTSSAFQSLLFGGQDEPPPTTDSDVRLEIPIRSQDPKDPQTGELWWNETSRRLMLKTRSRVWSTALEPGATHSAMRSEFAIDFYISFVLVLALAFGIAFETPVVVFFLAFTGIVSREAMQRGRRYVLFATVVAAAMLTPPDVISQLLLAGPMYLLFEVGLAVAGLAERKKRTDASD